MVANERGELGRLAGRILARDLDEPRLEHWRLSGRSRRRGQVVAGEAALDHGPGRGEVERAIRADGGGLGPSSRVEELVLLMAARELRADEIPGELVELGPF